MSTALMSTDINSNFNHDKLNVLGMAFNYDQLNRITASHSFEKINMQAGANYTWSSVDEDPKWQTNHSYDANGNINEIKRSGDNASTINSFDMDQLEYFYDAGTNQLDHVTDGITNAAVYDGDLESGQSGDNYLYDKIGNLIQDTKVEIPEVVDLHGGGVKKTRLSSCVIRL